MAKITAFIARSFDPADERKIEPILEFLKSFRTAGFLAESAERAEVESVSQKVRGMIDASDVFVGIFTRRYPIYEIEPRRRTRISFGRWEPKVARWVTPAWVIQESGYALKALDKRKMILFRESGVEWPSLQSDLEYIEFAESNFVTAFQKASEMINSLLAEASGTVVETVVHSASRASEAQPSAAESEVKEPISPPGLVDYYFQMKHALEAKEWDVAKGAHERLLTLVVEKNPELEIFWKANYHELRCRAGEPNAFEDLKTLAKENPDRPEPLAAMADCYYNFQEYEESAEYFIKAARLADGDDKAEHLAFAAKALRKAKKPREALQLLLEEFRTKGLHAASDRRLRKEVYAILKDTRNLPAAFAVGEWTLQENPADWGFRFSLSYDYEDGDFHDLSLFHYRILRDSQPQLDGVLNNIGLSYSMLKLPISAVDSYLEAYKNGNTLAANNLAQKYLEGGFTSNATTLINEAMKREDYEAQLPRTLAAIDENRKAEQIREESLLEEAEKYRRFLAAFGQGFLEETPRLNGKWTFHGVEIALSTNGGILLGEAESIVNVNHSPNVYAILAGTAEAREERRLTHFSGQLEGRTCKFSLKTETLPTGSLTIGSIIAAASANREGLIAFSTDGSSGTVCELKNGKPSEFYSISKNTE